MAFGAGLWISALMVRYRDFRFIVPFIVQFGFYISPVGFYRNVVPEQWRFLYSLNLMVGVIDGFRWAILGGQHTIYLPGFVLSLGVLSASVGSACGTSGRPKRRLRISSERVRGALGSRVRRLRRAETKRFSIRIRRFGNTAGALFAILSQFPAPQPHHPPKRSHARDVR